MYPFEAVFEAYCHNHGLQLFALPPRPPKLSGKGEPLQRTFGEEFYQCTDAPPRVTELAAELRHFEHTCNTIRPHYALGYRTPAEVLADMEVCARLV